MAGLIEALLSRNATTANAGAQPPPPDDDFWYGPAGTFRGRPSDERAMKARAVFGCLRVLSESTGILPLITYRRTDKGKERAPDHWLYRLLHDRPNFRDTPIDFWGMVVNHLNLRGIFAAYKVPAPGRPGEVAELLPLHPDRLIIRVIDRGQVAPGLVYEYTTSGGTPLRFSPSELFVVKFMTKDGVTPISVLEAAADSINLTLSAQHHGQTYYDNDASSAVAVINKHGFRTPKEREDDREAFQRMQTGANRYKTMYIQGDADVKQLRVGHKDAQFLESRSFQVEEICGFFRVPPHMIGHLQRSTFNNIEHQGIQFARLDLMPWLVRIEQAIQRDLVLEEDVFAKFLVAALERGDIKSRYEALNSAVTTGWLLRNEAREFEDLNRLDGMDEPLEPLNMGRSRERDDNANNGRAAQIDARLVKRLVCQEVESVTKLARRHKDDAGAFLDASAAFYGKHAAEVHHTLILPLATARAYCDHNLELVRAGGLAALETRAEAIERRLLNAITEADHAGETDHAAA